MEITKIVTSDPTLIYVGTKDSEEYYQKTNEMRGWSFMGLRPETEQDLRSNARDTDPEDILGVSRSDMNVIMNYFDYDRFADDMEEDWYDRHDVQAERENEEGKTLYLGFGSGQSIDGFFKNHEITDYASYCEYFDEIGLTEIEFKDLVEKYV